MPASTMRESLSSSLLRLHCCGIELWYVFLVYHHVENNVPWSILFSKILAKNGRATSVGDLAGRFPRSNGRVLEIKALSMTSVVLLDILVALTAQPLGKRIFQTILGSFSTFLPRCTLVSRIYDCMILLGPSSCIYTL
jgi:hypothetical protein